MSVETHNLPAKKSHFFVDGRPENPWLVGINFKSTSTSPRPVELQLDLSILIFEMKQCGVPITKDTARQFVADDIKDHGTQALDGYLRIVRYVLNPPPRRKNFGWFARMFTKPPKWTPPQPHWDWTSVTDINLSGEALVIKGCCCVPYSAY